MINIVAVATGGALGAVLRHFMVKFFTVGVFPSGVLIANLLGCFMLGLLVEILAIKTNFSEPLRYFLVVGFLGALTTFSTFILDLVLLNNQNNIKLALVYVTSSVFGGLLALICGMYLVKAILRFI
ncbi:MAG TPA: fluoride efflux transporter CrcB [Alphaproteobacteria bacterium]|nr:fluoride efflux transporter CrcB [Alphaproteobacteria bacterium]